MDKERIEFVKKCGELLNIAKPHLVSCELVLGKDLGNRIWNPNGGKFTPIPDDEYVVVTCQNAHTYTLCIEANTLMGIASDIFDAMKHK